MKVLHVLNHSLPHIDGYAIRSACIVSGQQKHGLQPIVVTSPKQEPKPIAANESMDGIDYYWNRQNVSAGLISLVRNLSVTSLDSQ